MTAKYEHIATVTLGSSANSITFSAIPQGYRDLELIINASVSTSGALAGEIYFNNDTNSGNYRFVVMGAGLSSTFTNSSASSTQIVFDADGGVNTLQIMDYSATDKHKTTLIRNSNPLDRVEASTVRWTNTNAITSIEITDQSQTYDAGSTFDLYGIVGGA